MENINSLSDAHFEPPIKQVDFENAYYLKLGVQGRWENVLIEGIKARIGWHDILLEDIIEERWDIIRKNIEDDYSARGKKSGATQDFNALKIFCNATDKDVFITFYDGKLYWCKLDENEIQADNISKFRTTKIKWSCQDINGSVLYANNISGRISKTQGFRATLCRIDEIESLRRIINAEKSPLIKGIEIKKSELCKYIQCALKELHWKDLEVLADLIFSQSGWRRISLIGGKMKYIDMELEDIITKERYQVQVKAAASKQDFEDYVEKFNGLDYSKLFFVVFNTDSTLKNYKSTYDNIELLTGKELSELIVDLGLVNWVVQKIN